MQRFALLACLCFWTFSGWSGEPFKPYVARVTTQESSQIIGWIVRDVAAEPLLVFTGRVTVSVDRREVVKLEALKGDEADKAAAAVRELEGTQPRPEPTRSPPARKAEAKASPKEQPAPVYGPNDPRSDPMGFILNHAGRNAAFHHEPAEMQLRIRILSAEIKTGKVNGYYLKLKTPDGEQFYSFCAKTESGLDPIHDSMMCNTVIATYFPYLMGR